MGELKKFLIDIDGVLYQGDEAIEGARETLEYLNENKYDFVLVTNTTRMPKHTIIRKLRQFGIEIDESRLITALSATVDYIKSKNNSAKCYLIAPDECDDDFEGTGILITREEEPVDFVVVGYDPRINFAMFDSAFRLILDGAELIAMHEDKTLPGKSKQSIGLGPFVKCLEYPTNKRAIIVGKPNKNFFNLGMEKISATPDETAMIGDSLSQDITGAKNAGLKTIMVKTGNYDETELSKSPVKPDYVIGSIKDLPAFLNEE